MQKVVGSSPIIRFEKPPETGVFVRQMLRRHTARSELNQSR